VHNIIVSIVAEMLPPEVTLFGLAAGTPVLWGERRGAKKIDTSA
jgi:hypothetical protein